MIPAKAVEAAAKVIYSDGWDGAPYWESMADDNSDKGHHRAIAQHALEAAAPHLMAATLTKGTDNE